MEKQIEAKEGIAAAVPTERSKVGLTPESASLQLVPYAKSPGHEFSKKKGITNWGEVPWGQIPWGNIPWSNVPSNIAKVSSSKSAENRVLGEFVRVRQDNERYGFVQLYGSETVFYANAKTVATLNALLDEPINRIGGEHPEVLNLLRAALN